MVPTRLAIITTSLPRPVRIEIIDFLLQCILLLLQLVALCLEGIAFPLQLLLAVLDPSFIHHELRVLATQAIELVPQPPVAVVWRRGHTAAELLLEVPFVVFQVLDLGLKYFIPVCEILVLPPLAPQVRGVAALVAQVLVLGLEVGGALSGAVEVAFLTADDPADGFKVVGKVVDVVVAFSTVDLGGEALLAAIVGVEVFGDFRELLQEALEPLADGGEMARLVGHSNKATRGGMCLGSDVIGFVCVGGRKYVLDI